MMKQQGEHYYFPKKHITQPTEDNHVPRKRPRTTATFLNAFQQFSLQQNKEEEVDLMFAADAVVPYSKSSDPQLINDDEDLMRNDMESTCLTDDDDEDDDEDDSDTNVLLLSDREEMERKVMYDLVFKRPKSYDPVEAKLQEWIRKSMIANPLTTTATPITRDDFNVNAMYQQQHQANNHAWNPPRRRNSAPGAFDTPTMETDDQMETESF